MANNIKVAFLLQIQHVSLPDPPEPKPRKTFVKPNSWKLSRRGKYLLASVIIAIVLISSFAFLSLRNNQVSIATQPQNNTSASPSPTPHPKAKGSSPPSLSGILTGISQELAGIGSQPKPPGVVESSPGMNDTVWTEVAENAWAFFQPGVGVDGTTGLPYAGGTDFKAFTDWDLGVYIQAVIDAQQIGLINANGTWGSNYRLDLVLTFLENRPLNYTTSNNWPFWFYDATNGQGYLINSTYASDGIDIVDAGTLLVALNNVRIYEPNFANQVTDFVTNEYGNRTNYAGLVPMLESSATSNSLYSYYVLSGFASFFPQSLGKVPSEILSNVFNSPAVTSPYGNVTLPDAPITCEPLLFSIFQLNNGDPRLINLMNQVYAASEAYYDSTGNYAAFTEGTSPYTGYIYEWVVAPNGSMWQITNATQYYFDSSLNPVVFTKAAFGFLAIYNSTFARNMVIYLEQALPVPTNGYYDGIDTSGALDAGNPGSDTNGMILDAALYYLQNNPNG